MNKRVIEDILLDKYDISMKKINRLAYSCLEENFIDDGLKLLQLNCKNNPCIQTLNNLAYFYFKFGVKNADGRWYPKPQKSIELLRNIEDYDGDLFIPYSLLGHIYYEMKDYNTAQHYFERAYQFNDTLGALINHAFLLYLTGEIENAEKLFDSAYLRDKSDIYMYYCSLFCKAVSPNNSVSSDVIFSLLKQTDNYDILEIDKIDIIYLLFIVNDFENVVKLYESAFEEYFISPSDFHIIAYSLHQLNHDGKIREYYERIVKDYNDDYDMPLNDCIEQLNTIYNNQKYLNKPKICLQVKLQQNCCFLE